MEDLQQNKKKFTVRDLVRAAIIAAVYALLTIFLAPISSGLVQCRVSEAMSILPYFTFSAVPGLFIGCMIANLLVGAPIYVEAHLDDAALESARCAVEAMLLTVTRRAAELTGRRDG